MQIRLRYLRNLTFQLLSQCQIRSTHGHLLEVNRQVCIIKHRKNYSFNYNSKTKLTSLIEIANLRQELVV